MSRIRGRDTTPELALRRAVWALGGRYRLKYSLMGKPDMIFPGPRVAVFVDGCFWHGCPEHGAQPKTNRDFWERKLARNKERDEVVSANLCNDGWIVLRFWEHEITQDCLKVAETVIATVGEKSRQ